MVILKNVIDFASQTNNAVTLPEGMKTLWYSTGPLQRLYQSIHSSTIIVLLNYSGI